MNESLNSVSQRKKITEIIRSINCNLTTNFGVSVAFPLVVIIGIVADLKILCVPGDISLQHGS